MIENVFVRQYYQYLSFDKKYLDQLIDDTDD